MYELVILVNHVNFLNLVNYSMIIGLVGEKFAGKDEIANFLVKKHSAEHFRFTHILDDILKSLGLPISRKNEIDLGLGLRKIFGERVLANALIERVKNAKADLIVVNGIRMDELDPIKNLGAKIIYITAPSEIRFARYQKRHEKTDDGAMDFEGFKQQETGPTEIGIPALGAKSDFRVDNVGTVEELYGQIEKIIDLISN